MDLNAPKMPKSSQAEKSLIFRELGEISTEGRIPLKLQHRAVTVFCGRADSGISRQIIARLERASLAALGEFARTTAALEGLKPVVSLRSFFGALPSSETILTFLGLADSIAASVQTAVEKKCDCGGVQAACSRSAFLRTLEARSGDSQQLVTALFTKATLERLSGREDATTNALAAVAEQLLFALAEQGFNRALVGGAVLRIDDLTEEALAAELEVAQTEAQIGLVARTFGVGPIDKEDVAEAVSQAEGLGFGLVAGFCGEEHTVERSSRVLVSESLVCASCLRTSAVPEIDELSQALRSETTFFLYNEKPLSELGLSTAAQLPTVLIEKLPEEIAESLTILTEYQLGDYAFDRKLSSLSCEVATILVLLSWHWQRLEDFIIVVDDFPVGERIEKLLSSLAKRNTVVVAVPDGVPVSIVGPRFSVSREFAQSGAVIKRVANDDSASLPPLKAKQIFDVSLVSSGKLIALSTADSDRTLRLLLELVSNNRLSFKKRHFLSSCGLRAPIVCKEKLVIEAGLMTAIASQFAATQAARTSGLAERHFDLSAQLGSCEACGGSGEVEGLQGFDECGECEGSGYSSEVLDIHYRGQSIAEVLRMNVERALGLFSDNVEISQMLTALLALEFGDVPLGKRCEYPGASLRLALLQAATKPKRGQLYIIDEPFRQIGESAHAELLKLFQGLTGAGSCVIFSTKYMGNVPAAVELCSP